MSHGGPHLRDSSAKGCHRPLVYIAPFFALGVYLASSHGLPLLPWLACGGAALIGITIAILKGRRALLTAACLLLAMAAGGGYYVCRRVLRPADSVCRCASASRKLVQLEGTVAGFPRFYPQTASASAEMQEVKETSEYFSRAWASFVLKAKAVNTGEGWRTTSGRVLVSASNLRSEDVRAGRDYRILGAISKLRSVRNEHENPPPLGARGIECKLSTDQARNVRPAPEATPNVLAVLARLRRTFRNKIRRLLPAPSAGLAMAVILGDRYALEPDVYAAFRETGTVHFLAISGLHIGILWLSLRRLLRALGMPLRARILISIGFVWIYALMTAAQPPVLRAAVMITLLLCAPLFGRQSDHPSTLAAAILCVLLINPSELFNAGFQLSVASVAAIIWIRPRIMYLVWPWRNVVKQLQEPQERTIKERARDWCAEWFCLSASVWLATAPLMIYHFATLTPLPVVLNPLIVYPMTAFLWGSLALCVLPQLPVVSPLLVLAVHVCCRTMVLLVLGAARLFAPVSVPHVGTVWAFAAMALIFAWVARRRLRLRLAPLVASCIILAAVPFAEAATRRTTDDLRIDFLDVGHGLCCIMRAPDDTTLVFDAGSLEPRTAQRVLLPFLRAEGICKIDLLMLSHEHFDHMSMAPDLLRRLPVGHVAVNNHFGKTAAGRHMLAAFRSHDIPVSAMRAGDCLRVGSTCVHILNPPHDWEINPPPGELLNETSLVALVRSEVGQVMLTGDAGLSALAPLVFADHTTGGVDVLQAPHHGTPSMASAALLRKLRPRLVVASRSASAWLPGEIRTLPLPEATRYYDTALDGMTTITLSASASACVRTFLRRAESTAKAKPSPEGAEAHWQ